MNRKCLIILFLCILITLAGCSGINSKQKNIYTNNKQIAEEADTYTYLTYLNRIDSIDSTEKINQINLEFSKFYGADTLWNIESTGKQELLNLFEGTDEGIIEMDLEEGRYRLKIVGQDAKGKIQIDIGGNTNIELEKNE